MADEAKTRFYGDGGTIHGTTHVDVETRGGKVVAVWFRCAAIPFKQTKVEKSRAIEMERMYAERAMPEVHGLMLSETEREVTISDDGSVTDK